MNTTPTDHKIEFMAWDESNNILHFNVEFIKSGDNGNDWIIFKSDKQRLEDKKVFDNPYFSQQIKIMQRTALRSINDEPIYNHMIVKSYFFGYFLVDMFNYKLMHALSNKQLKIVGNRFQHPELLELCK